MKKDWIKSIIENGEFSREDGVRYWHEWVFKSILLILILFGFFAFLFGMYMSIKTGNHIITVLDVIVYTSVVLVLFVKRLSLAIRKYIIIGLPYIVGVSLVFFVGPTSEGLSYLIGACILATLLLGLRGSIYSISISGILVVIIAIGLYFDAFGNLMISQYTPITWITTAVNVLIVSSITSFPLAVFIRGLESTINKQNKIKNLLKEKVFQLENAKFKAEEADKLKTDFLANMSHEVRTPLNSIMGFTELVIHEAYADEKEKTHYLNTINKNGGYLLNIINNILDFSTIESGQLKNAIQTFDLEVLMKELHNIYTLPINTKAEVSIQFNGLNDIGETIIKTDRHRLKQVLINLINNALKFTEKGKVEIGFRLKVNVIEFYVKDSGIGISKKDQGAIFKRFIKVNGLNKVKEGAGLGLPISKGIIEALGGTIWVESEVGAGAKFYFTIPN